MFGREYRGSNTRRRWVSREGRCGSRSLWNDWRAHGVVGSIGIAAIFWLGLSGLLMLRGEVVPYRPGQYLPHDITARVDFNFFDSDKHTSQVDLARENAPHVYREVPGDFWGTLQNELLSLPDRVHDRKLDQLDPPLHDILDSGALTQLEQDRVGPDRQRYQENVRQYIDYARKHLTSDSQGSILVILKQDDWNRETDGQRRPIILRSGPPDSDNAHPAATPRPDRLVDVAADTYTTPVPDSVLTRLEEFANRLDLNLGSKIARLTAVELGSHPNYALDDAATAEQKLEAAKSVELKDAFRHYYRNMVIVPKGPINDHTWQLLRDENTEYHNSLTASAFDLWQYRFGTLLTGLVFTILLCAYIARYQPRCVRNHTRGWAIAGLLLAMLLLSQLAGIGSNSLYIYGITPTIVSAMILTIAYDQRFALGIATIHGLIVTVALNQGLGFLLILWTGVLCACYLLDDIRTRSKLIEIGGVAAVAMIVVTFAIGAAQSELMAFIWRDCLYTGAAGLAAGFIVLGILPFIEKLFRITTSMTLLELADASQPLLRRLAIEAPGTYNHSLQVATLAEAAAESIGANSLLCRVGSYYHDIGKINKPDYFIENQQSGENRHINLTPSLSLRIILSHVKDGVEMAREYNLPTSILPIIQQHHGTTLVEYFYYQACNQNDKQPEAGPRLSDTEFRYPGPKPKSKESAVVMLCDAVESACRAMGEPTASRIDALVHELAMKRLHDGQFDECDLTMKDLAAIEQALSKALLGIYHGRIAYPSTKALTRPSAPAAPDVPPAIKTA